MLSVVKISKVKTSRLPYQGAMKKVLGKKYDLEIIFATPKLMKTIKQKFTKNPPAGGTNILSFGLSERQGQIFLEPNLIKKESPLYNRSFRSHLWALYVHGLLHLKGYIHGRRMEIMEKKLCQGT